MADTQHPSGSRFHQRKVDMLGEDQFLGRRFRNSLREVASVVPIAHPRFNEVGRVDRDAAWTGYVIEMCREQLYRASAEGPEEKAETVRRVQRMCRELENAILTGFIEEPGRESAPITALSFLKESQEAALAVQTFRETGSDSDAERARREVQDVLSLAPVVLDLTARRRPQVVRLAT